ncbi:hypothetical protein PVAND_007051 [Polypedilum vanderplanki]|uniref:Uncharacterized protein n=1 Tax=Polypedilum vanderplanki TaxID=319348 RepID=A0A9J6C578_POLVA|nr:hypothetical protein PVAND_007051 [Polypedilum vanderplanki]
MNVHFNQGKTQASRVELIRVATSSSSKARKASSEIRGLAIMNDTATNNRRGSVDGVITRCGICSLFSSLLRRAMCVGSRRGSGESYYQELAETAAPEVATMETTNDTIYIRLIRKSNYFQNKTQ